MSPNRLGIFIAIVGPSGAGKDTLMREARALLAGRTDIRFARRVVTRVADTTLEDHDTMDEAAFRAAARRGVFCLSWQAHGLRYGLPRALKDSVSAGCAVVANISRRAIPDATRVFPVIDVIEITARPEIRAERLMRRGRETEARVRERIARDVACDIPLSVRRFIRIDNSAGLEEAARMLAKHLRDIV
ncbi:ribose 1,5-bisphosphate phosphokinase PhnN [Brucella endophytica]|uniref:Ribose 1,5-bisphosphate phosphokinase PhnN n=1 Tax=Brucella endophytica TaxID=1963359 RepID=A0A916SPA0_9HYPH|nr:phosphonate metabolism protein/1,5-bisphosphokinase (PRPP-forming) PhnN [Brucella endophytica]GGB06483.1 ribose 1,5-bisphosphate phosphokinase PhnN [Brucella endophytica]